MTHWARTRSSEVPLPSQVTGSQTPEAPPPPSLAIPTYAQTCAVAEDTKKRLPLVCSVPLRRNRKEVPVEFLSASLNFAYDVVNSVKK